MKIIYQDGAPPLPFPTAFPGTGTMLANPVSGQHATNATKLRYHSIRNKNNFSQYWRRQPQWLPAFPPPNPNFASVQQFDTMFQTWVTQVWLYQLPPENRSAWQTLASVTPLHNYYGQLRYMSGFGFFCRMARLYNYGPNNRQNQFDPTASLPWETVPAIWPTLPTPAFTRFDLYAGPPFNPPAPWPALYFVFTPTSAYYHLATDFNILAFAPGKLTNARKQGSLVWLGLFAYPPHPATVYGTAASALPQRLAPGTTLTLIITNISGKTAGESAPLWLTLTAQALPWHT